VFYACLAGVSVANTVATSRGRQSEAFRTLPKRWIILRRNGLNWFEAFVSSSLLYSRLETTSETFYFAVLWINTFFAITIYLQNISIMISEVPKNILHLNERKSYCTKLLINVKF